MSSAINRLKKVLESIENINFILQTKEKPNCSINTSTKLQAL